MDYKLLVYEVKNRIARITLNDPDKMNALGGAMIMEITMALQEAKADENVKVVVITGTGKAFCAGGDISGFTDFDNLEGTIDFVKGAHKMVQGFLDLPKPVIAAVNGSAVGAGLSLALLSDIVIASDKAKFGLAFANMGLVADCAALYFLPKQVGLQKAKELAFTGKNINAEEAHRIGIVNTVVEYEKLEDAVSELSAKLAGMPGLAIGSAKRILNMSFDLGLNELLELEAFSQSVCKASEDCKEAVDAFMNKRKPVFK